MGNTLNQVATEGDVEGADAASSEGSTPASSAATSPRDGALLHQLESLRNAIPIIKQNPEDIYLIESHIGCPSGSCPSGSCRHLGRSKEMCATIVKNLKSKGCMNTFLLKPWGCMHPEIKNRDYIKLSKVLLHKLPSATPSDPQLDTDPAPTAEQPQPNAHLDGNAEPEITNCSDSQKIHELNEKVLNILESREITFVKNCADLDDDGREVCKAIALELLKSSTVDLNIESHTNCRLAKCSEFCFMADLCQKRCDAVQAWFVENGCQHNISSKGWGCKHPKLGATRQFRISVVSST